MIYNWNIALVEDFFIWKLWFHWNYTHTELEPHEGIFFLAPVGALIPVGPIPTSYGVLTLLGSRNHYLT